MIKSLALLAAAASGGLAAVVKYDFDIGWVKAAPDGVERDVIGINGKWPLPTVEATVGDRVIVNVHNSLGNQSTGLHWHGIHQLGTSHMDGPAHGTQCPIPPGSTFTYDFIVDQAGTYWYHSHTGSQYPDGLRGPMIVRDKLLEDPYKGEYDEEYLLTVSDWYRQDVPTILRTVVFNTSNTNVAPPLPPSALINDASNAVVNTELKFVPGKKYKIRVVNMAALAGVVLFFDQHKMQVIEIDAAYVEKTEAEQIYLSPAQRYSFIIEAKDTADKNYAFSAVFDLNPNFQRPVPTIGFNLNVTGSLQYDSSAPFPAPVTTQSWKILDDFNLKPLKIDDWVDSPTDVVIPMDLNLGLDEWGVPRAFVNGKPYVHQKVPTLYTAVSAGDEAENPVIYGDVNPFIVKEGQVVEFVLNNLHRANHPFHFHGHHFQVCKRGAPNSGVSNSPVDCSESAMVRDTVIVNANSTAVIRFKADNPGVWLLHCHLEWHVPLGLTATIIEDPFAIQDTIEIPRQHIEVCKAQCMPYEGNAAGNKQNLTDLTGANHPPEDADHGAIYAQGTCTTTTTTATLSSVSQTSTSTSSATGTHSHSASTTSDASYTGTTTSATGTHSESSSKPTGTATSHSDTSTAQWTTSTLYTTTTITATSCPPTVTNCPNTPYVTTTVVPYTTTVCTVTTNEEYTTSTLYSKTTYTVTSCAPTVTNCPHTPYVTTSLIATATTVCPISSHSQLPTAAVTPSVTFPDGVQYTTSTLCSTRTYTVTSCPADLTTSCPPVPYVTTELIPTATTVCPVTTGTGTGTTGVGTKSYGAHGSGSTIITQVQQPAPTYTPKGAGAGAGSVGTISASRVIAAPSTSAPVFVAGAGKTGVSVAGVAGVLALAAAML